MKITQQHYEKIVDTFPRQRGNVTIDNLTMLNAILYLLEHGCNCIRIPSYFGNLYSIYTRMSRWSKNGVLDRIFARLQQEQLLHISPAALSIDSTVTLTEPGH